VTPNCNPSAFISLVCCVTFCLYIACLLCCQADVYERLDALDSDTTEARAASILHGLGFDKEMQVGCRHYKGESTKQPADVVMLWLDAW
jgi:hypothetical protein